MNGRITDIIRNNGERLKSIKAGGTVLYRHSGLHYVKTMLARFCDGLRRISYSLRLVLDGLRRFLTILVINETKTELGILFYCPATKPCLTVKNRQ